MVTRDVAVAFCAKALRTLKPTMLRSEATMTWAQALAVGSRRLRRLARQTR